jgi:hypothetical protein
MKATRVAPSLAAALLAMTLAPNAASAYVDVELMGNRHVIGDSYVDQGAKLIVYRPSGAMEVDRAQVRSIQEHEGSMPNDVQRFAAPEASSAATSASTTAPATVIRSKDPQTRDQELSGKLMDMRLDRLAAKQRGDETTMKKLDKEIHTLQDERNSNWKKLHRDTDADTADDR